MQDERIISNYKWLQGMATAKYQDVVFGRYIARPTKNGVPMNIENRDTYYKVEKGTDINLAIHALSKAHYNSYDAAFIMSADTDYISLYRQLKVIGKIVIAVAVSGQKIPKIIPEVDDFLILTKSLFSQCIRSQQGK
ncbi:MAG: NYN domain-containing protein [Oscillospiraceae bacterium]|nr:NYN domain-containing protein [Oscillospiraceae bacterium]